MKISIITPSYNQEKYLERTILSVWNQEGDFELEHIVIDGGSTDNSIDILSKYDNLYKSNLFPFRCKDMKFFWESKPDQGQDDAEVNPEKAQAIELRGFIQFGGDAGNKLAEQENVEGVAEKIRNDQRQQGVDPAQVAENDKGWNHGHFPRNHHGAEQDQKQEVFARRAQAGEAIGYHAAGDHLTQDGKNHKNETVQEKAREVQIHLENAHEILKMEFFGEECKLCHVGGFVARQRDGDYV